MKYHRRNAGFTLVELMIALPIGMLVIFAVASLTYMASASFECISTQTYTDIGAVNAMNRIVNDVRESKSVQLISANWMRGTFPVRMPDGRYNRAVPDLNSTYDYYLGDSSGNYSATGNCIWVRHHDGSARRLVSGARTLEFSSDSPRSLQITISMQTEKRGKPFRCDLTERVVYLRNY